MRIALLGIDANTLALAAEIARDGRHELVIVADGGSELGKLHAIVPQLRSSDDWRQVLNGQAVEATFVAADQPSARVDQLRHLLQAEMPVLVSHPLGSSMLDCYELDMIRRETGNVIIPYLPARHHPATAELERILDEGESSSIGVVEQIACERFLAKRDRATVFRHFAQDVDLLQLFAGQASKLHAHGATGGKEGPYANLAVQISGESALVGRWSVAPIELEPGAKLTLVGSRGKATLWMPEQHKPWRLEVYQGGQTTSRDIEAEPTPAMALDQLAAAIAGAEVHPDWTEASRCVELAETIDRSLARGRTIDLHREEFSDIGTFKGTMASIGCGLLLAAMVIIFLAAALRTIAVDAGFHRLANVLGLWPYALLAVLGIYLVLQFLVFIGKSPDRRTQADDRPPPRD